MPALRNSTVALVFLTALSLSIGWGIRGNYGHEFGAMIPGALAAMAAVLLSGREDWGRRIAYFAFFGALGWSFGGSISYMQVIAYTHSGHSGSVLYGFASLFVIGFLWAAMGGAGTALPAVLDRDRLTEFFAPLCVVFAAWWLQGVADNWFVAVNPQFRQESPLYWYDTDWLAALVAIVAVLAFALVRRRLDAASSLILHSAVGWWIGFLVLVVALGWRMTPPRGDNWAGCVGMTIGMWVYFQRQGLSELTLASLIAGFIGGFAFATATLLKLVWVTTGWETNWHSVLEQTYGLINGIGVAVALLVLTRRAPRLSDEPPVHRWTEPFAIGFVLVGLTYLNLRKNPEAWVKAKTVPEFMYGMAPIGWFNLGYATLAVAVIWLFIQHRRNPLPAIPTSWLGRGQLFYLAFLWCMVLGNFERALVSFAPQRLVTEGVIFLNAVVCTGMLLSLAKSAAPEATREITRAGILLKRTAVIGTAAMMLSVLADWGIVRAIYGDGFAGHAGKHIRFGPNATATKEKPKAGQAHP